MSTDLRPEGWSRRRTLLLGAGASADAGLPLTGDLAELAVRRANEHIRQEPWDGDWVTALNFVYSAIRGHRADAGTDPFEAVNIEKLISALRLLQIAQSHEAAPFVAAWREGALDRGAAHVPAELGSGIFSALERWEQMGAFHAEQRMADAVARIARASTRPGDSTVFAKTEAKMLGLLRDILGALRSVDYLTPIASLAHDQPGGIDVITLNYDLAIETLAQQQHVVLDRGIDRWAPGKRLDFRMIDGHINLIKLHGSLDWINEAGGGPADAPSVRIWDEAVDQQHREFGLPSLPWIVVGDREKLATDGPTLALLRAAEEALERTDHLIVVGYSFGDAHINHMIRNWLLADETRTLAVGDPFWDPERLDAFPAALVNRYGANPATGRSRLVAIPGAAAASLNELIQCEPADIPATYATADLVAATPEVFEFEVTLHGPDLRRAAVHLTRPRDEPTGTLPVYVSTFTTRQDLEAYTGDAISTNRYRAATIDTWGQSSTRTVYTRAIDATRLRLEIMGFRNDTIVPLNIASDFVIDPTAVGHGRPQPT